MSIDKIDKDIQNESEQEQKTEEINKADPDNNSGCSKECEAGESTDSADSEDKDKEESDGREEKKKEKAAQKENKGLKEENSKLSVRAAELEDKYKRTLAEYDNFRKRSTRERETVYNDAYADALKEILPVIDNLERALTFADAESAADDKLTEGVQMTINQFGEVLKKMGIEVFGKPGDKFDGELHDAVMHAEDETFGENEIAEVFQKGYKIGDRVIRYAMVKVVN